MRAESEELLLLAEAAKNDTASDLEAKLENSKKAIRGLEENIDNIEQKHEEVQFMLNTFKDGMSCCLLLIIVL